MNSVNDRFCTELGKLCQSKEFIKPLDSDVDKTRAGLNGFFGLQYKKDNERFYSEVLKGFLDPSARHGDGVKFLMQFVRYLKHVAEIKGKECVFRVMESIEENGGFDGVSVEKERGYVDVLIRKGDEWAIIIENKICGETDQKHQIPRYFDAQHVKKCVVVYLKAYEDDAMPVDIDFTAGDKQNVAKYLLPVAGALGNDVAELSLLNGWASICADVTSDEKTRKALGWFMDLLRKRADGVFNLGMAPAVAKLMRDYGVTYATLSDIKVTASRLIQSLIDSVELYAFHEVARRSKRIGKFSLGVLHDRGEKMTLFMHNFLNGEMLLVLDVRAKELSFNIRRGRTAVSIDDCLSELFGSAVVRIRRNRYALPLYQNATIEDMIDSAEKLLKLISKKEGEINSALRKL